MAYDAGVMVNHTDHSHTQPERYASVSFLDPYYTKFKFFYEQGTSLQNQNMHKMLSLVYSVQDILSTGCSIYP